MEELRGGWPASDSLLLLLHVDVFRGEVIFHYFDFRKGVCTISFLDSWDMSQEMANWRSRKPVTSSKISPL